MTTTSSTLRAVSRFTSPIRQTIVALVAACVPVLVAAQSVLRWSELTAVQIGALDREHTVVLIPAGIVAEQGSLLPSGAELFRSERMAADLADVIGSRAGWTAVLLPPVPLGSGAFDRRSGRDGFSGTLAVRASTVQAIFTDLATALGEQGLRHVFIVDGQADANHARALDLAGDYFAANFPGKMIHLLGRNGCDPRTLQAPPITLLGATAMTADVDSPHAGVMQTSRDWFLRPELVDSLALRAASDVSANGADAWTRTVQRPDWPGYIGAPRFANLELGKWLYDTELRSCSALALRFLDGLPESTVPRFADRMRAYPDVRALLTAQARRDEDVVARQKRAIETVKRP